MTAQIIEFDYDGFASRLRQHRVRMGLTIEEAATAGGRTAATWRKYEATGRGHITRAILFNGFREPPAHPRTKSQYELYPLPFFSAADRCTWKVQPTGDYGVDCQKGRYYAVEFLRSC